MENLNTNSQNSVATSALELKEALAPIYRKEGEININSTRIVSCKDKNYGWFFMVFYSEEDCNYYGSERSIEEVAKMIWERELRGKGNRIYDIVNASIQKSDCQVENINIKQLPSIIQIDLTRKTHKGSESIKLRLRDTYDLEVPYVSDLRLTSDIVDLIVDLRYHLINGDFDFTFSKEIA